MGKTGLHLHFTGSHQPCQFQTCFCRAARSRASAASQTMPNKGETTRPSANCLTDAQLFSSSKPCSLVTTERCRTTRALDSRAVPTGTGRIFRTVP